MSQQKPNYVILPPGTVVAEANRPGARNFVLDQPVSANVQNVWEESFRVEFLSDRDGKSIPTGLKINYLLVDVSPFASGQTREEAWQNFDNK